jgi:hypothetical protein
MLMNRISIHQRNEAATVAGIGSSEYKGTNYPIPFGSYGDFSCIVGASKVKRLF